MQSPTSKHFNTAYLTIHSCGLQSLLSERYSRFSFRPATAAASPRRAFIAITMHSLHYRVGSSPAALATHPSFSLLFTFLRFLLAPLPHFISRISEHLLLLRRRLSLRNLIASSAREPTPTRDIIYITAMEKKFHEYRV